MSVEAFNAAGSTMSPMGTVTVYSPHNSLTTGALIGITVGLAASVILILALMVCTSVLASRRKTKSSGLPPILSRDFENERLMMVRLISDGS